MNILQLIAMVLGHIWIVAMIARAPAVFQESRVFLECLRHINYQARPRWFTFFRYMVPNLLTSPVLLLMNGRHALNPLSEQDVYQGMLCTVEAYGQEYREVEEEEPEPTEVEKCLDNPVTPYNRQLQVDSVEDIFEEVVKVRKELGLELPPADRKKLH